MIPKKTLTKWRREALKTKNSKFVIRTNISEGRLENIERLIDGKCERILRMTQELLDQHLIKEPKKGGKT